MPESEPEPEPERVNLSLDSVLWPEIGKWMTCDTVDGDKPR